MLKIMFDVFDLLPNRGKSIGIYTYSVNLASAICRALPANSKMFIVCNAAAAKDFQFQNDSNVELIVIGANTPSYLSRLAWVLWRADKVARELGVSVYFTPKGFMPRITGQIATVSVIHDLIPLWYTKHYPKHFGRFEQFATCSLFKYTITSANHIVAISQATSDAIKSTYGKSANVTVVLNGIKQPSTAISERPQDGPFIFAITSDLPHKNRQGVVDAYLSYRKKAANPQPLILCGGADPEVEGIVSVRNISDDLRNSFYTHCSAFLFLSRIEGFGFPPLEAMALGATVICSDIPSLKETTRGMAVYVNPDDTEAIAESLVAVCEQQHESRGSEIRGFIETHYSWERCASEVIDVLYRANREKSGHKLQLMTADKPY